MAGDAGGHAVRRAPPRPAGTLGTCAATLTPCPTHKARRRTRAGDSDPRAVLPLPMRPPSGPSCSGRALAAREHLCAQPAVRGDTQAVHGALGPRVQQAAPHWHHERRSESAWPVRARGAGDTGARPSARERRWPRKTSSCCPNSSHLELLAKTGSNLRYNPTLCRMADPIMIMMARAGPTAGGPVGELLLVFRRRVISFKL